LANLQVSEGYSNYTQLAYSRNGHLDPYAWKKLCQPLPPSFAITRRGLPTLPTARRPGNLPVFTSISSPNTFRNFTLTYVTDRTLGASRVNVTTAAVLASSK
ncbi:hypothetical protein Ciccas_013628, partial [Cichlidogyrus casuarinus]